MSNDAAAELPGVASECWLLKFDEQGDCISPDTRRQLLAVLAARPACRVILISHGWNNDFSDAVDLYARFMRQVEAFGVLASDEKPAVLVGVIWPSSWAPRDKGPVIAGGAPPISDRAYDPAFMLLDGLSDGSARQQASDLLSRATLSSEEATILASHVVAALAASSNDPAREVAEAPPNVGDVLTAMQALGRGSTAPSPDDWAAGTQSATEIGKPAAAGWLSIDPMMAVRVFSVYQMKDRAGRVGASGVARLLDALLATPHPIHAVGHSYGCKVLLSALCGGSPPPRPIESLLLLQPALSHLAFAASVPGRDGPGGYRAALSPDHVRQPIVSTFSACDLPLHTVFHLALRRVADLGELLVAAGGTRAGEPPSVYCALGGYGPRGSDEQLIDPLPRAGEPYALLPGKRICAFDGTLDKRIGGHGDVTSDMTAWLFAQQVLA